jgi:7-cyano-7-deazaguanine synthase in queuosine biosynthesis
MSHHTIICRLGAGDTVQVLPSRPDSVITNVDFLDDRGRLKFGLGQTLDQLSGWGLTPTEVAIDLALLATALTAADTRISRQADSQDHWTREIDLHLPVMDCALWDAQRGLLERTLRFLTGDHWQVFFRARPDSHATLVAATGQLRLISSTCVCLLSGGLDSFIGAIDLLREGQAPLFVSHWWDTMAAKHQSYCMTQLQARFAPRAFNHLRANVGFDHHTVTSSAVEDTLRGRSFLFFALATVAASAIGGEMVVHTPENGLISLNVPLDPLRLGALSTRTTHPFYVARFSELLRNLGLPVQLHNRYRHRTKGQMVAECQDLDFLRRHAKHTMSCSGPSKYRFHPDESMRKLQHCGHCVPCLIRRASLLRGLGADDTPYTVSDLRARVIDSDKAEGEHIRAFQVALARLAAKPTRSRLDIHQPGPLCDHPGDLAGYEAVYVEGMREVAQLLDGVRAKPLS